MKQKILYLFSDTGGGHRSAASAIIRAAEHVKLGKYEQRMVDVFAECSGFLNVFARLYGPVVNYSPKMWGRLYYWLDDKKKIEALEKLARPFILKELTQLIKQSKPDVIVSVHPLINHLTIRAIKQSGRKIPFIVVITDPVTLHRAWITPGVDRCIVATEQARQHALVYGMPAEKIKVIGMPIDPKFFLPKKGPQNVRKKFTILLMGGGEGGGGLYEIIKELNLAKVRAQLIVIAGRNRKLERRLKKEVAKFRLPMQVLGFTDKVPELMAESDLLITKAGPGTIAEAMAMNLPLIITSWLPGQEEGNVEFVVKERVGRVSKEPKKIAEIVQELQQGPVYDQLKKNIKRVSRPKAAIEIANEIFHYL